MSEKIASRLQLLLTDKRRRLDSPTTEGIDKLFRILFSKKKHSWATLSRGICDYITAQGSRESGFTVEYEMGSMSLHQRIKQVLDLDLVIRLFQAYARNDFSWYEEFKWELVGLKEINKKHAPSHPMIHPDLTQI